MKSKTSFCNGTILAKNLLRFVPAWLLYTLCLLLGLTLMVVSDDHNFWFASNMGEMVQYSSIINLIYGPLVAMLLFGDLYNPRMCNAIHAMPLKRGCWFGSHVISGLLFSLIPTAIFCAMSLPILARTCVVGAQWLALWAFVGMNLTYLCFFGIAVFSAFCAGNRFGMVAVYILLNAGAYIAFFLLNSIYTPLFYGVLTPSTLWGSLTPVNKLAQSACVELESWGKLTNLYANDLSKIQAHFWLLPEGWMTQGLWALVGVGCLLLGRILYGRRKLECAGDTMAIKALEPVFLVCVAACCAAFGNMFLELFLGTHENGFVPALFMACGLVAGWFAGKMLIERTVRVFRLKNWLGLLALSAVLAASLGMAYYDVFGIESWVPKAEDVKSVTFGYSSYRGMSQDLTGAEDIAQVIRLQELALQDRPGEPGTYVEVDGRIYTGREAEELGLEDQGDHCYATDVMIHYTMKNGRQIQRQYTIWGHGETGDIVREYLSRWEVVGYAGYYGELSSTVVGEMTSVQSAPIISINGTYVPEPYRTQETIDSLIAAIQADCEARTMTQRSAFHTGHFHVTYEDGTVEDSRSFWIEFGGKNYKSGSFNVFPDSENTLEWLRHRGLLPYPVCSENGCSHGI